MRGISRQRRAGSMPAGRHRRRAWCAPVRALACAIALAAPLVSTAVALGDSTPTPQVAVAQLNDWRQAVGVGPVALDDSLSAGCRQHATYFRANPLTRGHAELASAPGYSEVGDLAARTSVLAYGLGVTRGPLVWESAPYHRMALLDPRLVTTGFWSEFGIGCMNVGETDGSVRQESLTAYTYPVSGQRDVPTSFACDEAPNPCLLVHGNNGRTPTGYIISVQFNGPWDQLDEVRVASAELKPSQGPALPLTVESSDGALRSGMLLIPDQPLAAGTTYAASASGSVVGRADDGAQIEHHFGLSWDFSTPGVDPAASLKVTVSRITRAAIHLRLDLRSKEPRRARISLLNDRTPLLRVIRQLAGTSKTVVLKRPRARVTTVAVLLRGTPTQIGVAARLKTNIRPR